MPKVFYFGENTKAPELNWEGEGLESMVTRGVVPQECLVMKVACGDRHGLLLDQHQNLYMFGVLHSKQHVLPLESRRLRRLTHGMVQVASGHSHVLALSAQGALYSWGDNAYGQCLQGPVYVENLTKVDLQDKARRYPSLGSLSSDTVHSIQCAEHGSFLKQGEQYFGCGWNKHQQLGESGGSSLGLSRIDGLVGMRGLVAGVTHCLAWDGSGRLFSFGEHSHAKLGLQESSSQVVRQVHWPSSEFIVQAACGCSSSMALSIKGTVFQWGHLLNETEPSLATTPQMCLQMDLYQPKDLGLQHIVKVETKYNQCLALDSHGTLFTWGCNLHLSLGHPHRNFVSAPQAVGALAKRQVLDASFGSSFLCVSSVQSKTLVKTPWQLQFNVYKKEYYVAQSRKQMSEHRTEESVSVVKEASQERAAGDKTKTSRHSLHHHLQMLLNQPSKQSLPSLELPPKRVPEDEPEVQRKRLLLEQVNTNQQSPHNPHFDRLHHQTRTIQLSIVKHDYLQMVKQNREQQFLQDLLDKEPPEVDYDRFSRAKTPLKTTRYDSKHFLQLATRIQTQVQKTQETLSEVGTRFQTQSRPSQTKPTLCAPKVSKKDITLREIQRLKRLQTDSNLSNSQVSSSTINQPNHHQFGIKNYNERLQKCLKKQGQIAEMKKHLFKEKLFLKTVEQKREHKAMERGEKKKMVVTKKVLAYLWGVYSLRFLLWAKKIYEQAKYTQQIHLAEDYLHRKYSRRESEHMLHLSPLKGPRQLITFNLCRRFVARMKGRLRSKQRSLLFIHDVVIKNRLRRKLLESIKSVQTQAIKIQVFFKYIIWLQNNQLRVLSKNLDIFLINRYFVMTREKKKRKGKESSMKSDKEHPHSIYDDPTLNTNTQEHIIHLIKNYTSYQIPFDFFFDQKKKVFYQSETEHKKMVRFRVELNLKQDSFLPFSSHKVAISLPKKYSLALDYNNSVAINRLVKLELEAKKLALRKMLFTLKRQMVTHYKEYQRKIERFIVDRREDINLERTRIMLQTPTDQLRQIMKDEDDTYYRQIDCNAKQKDILPRDHLPFIQNIRKIAKKLDGTPQKKKLTLRLTDLQNQKLLDIYHDILRDKIKKRTKQDT